MAALNPAPLDRSFRRAAIAMFVGGAALAIGCAPKGPVNRPPVAIGYTAEVVEDLTTLVKLTGVDPDGDPLTRRILTEPSHGTLLRGPRDLFYRPDPDFDGVDEFEFVVNDGSVDSAPAWLRLEILGLNDRPSADAGPELLVRTDQLVELDGRGSSDPDGDVLQYEWSQTAGTPVELDDPTSRWPRFVTPRAETVLLFRLVVDDGYLSDTDELEVSVRDVTPPAPIRGFQARAGDGVVDLEWQLPTDPEVVSVRILRSEVQYPSDPAGVAMFDGPETAVQDVFVRNGVEYFYIAWAVDGAGLYSEPQRATATPGPGVEPYYRSEGANWNQYVLNDGATRFEATGLPCTTQGGGAYDTCIHGGELRVVAGLPITIATCAGVTAADDLGAFDWTCLDGGGWVRVVSTGLRPQTRLADLLNPAVGRWRPNAVTVRLQGADVYRTIASEWWDNPIFVNPVNPLLARWGGVYVITRDAGLAYEIAGSGISFVSTPGVELTTNPVQPVLFGLRVDYLWIEAHANGVQLVELILVERSVLRHVRIDATPWPVRRAGLKLSGTEGLWVTDVSGVESGGIDCRGSAHNTFERIDLQMGPVGRVWVGGDDHTVSDLTIEGGLGVRIDGNRHVVERLHASGTALHGLHVSGNGTRARDVLVEGASSSGVYTDGTLHWLERVTSVRNTGGGVAVRGGVDADTIVTVANGLNGFSLQAGKLRHLIAANNGGHGLLIRGFAPVVASDILVVGNGGAGVSVNSPGSGVLHSITAVNNGAAGIAAWGTIPLLANVVAANNPTGISISDSSGGTTTALNVALLGNDVGVELTAGTAVFTGQLVVGDNLAACVVTAGTGLVDGSCANVGASDATLLTGASLSGALLGPVATDDLVNTDDADGAALYETITDWSGFEHRYRAWGLDGGAFPDGAQRGACLTTGFQCRVWDWQVSSTDAVLRAVVGVPGGNDTVGFIDGVPRTGLRGAVELSDGVGNDDFIRESFENCLYLPNLGAYQGHGNLVQIGQIPSGGTIENVVLYAYEVNGG